MTLVVNVANLRASMTPLAPRGATPMAGLPGSRRRV